MGFQFQKGIAMDQNIKTFLKHFEIDGVPESMTVIQAGSYEGCTVNEAARLYSVKPSAIRFHLASKGPPAFVLAKKQVQALKISGFVHKHSANLRLLDIEAMLFLGKTFGTPRSLALSEALQNGPITEADQGSI